MNQRYYSNIYWHFTGSPKDIEWANVKRPADIIKQNSILDDSSAKDILKLILDSNILKGSCVECVTDELKTEKFCCVTDIPVKDLPSHSSYYGKVAIGFNPEAIHKSFVPVLYIPTQNFPVIEKLVPNRKITKMAHDFFSCSGSFQKQQGLKMLAQATNCKEIIEQPDMNNLKGFFSNFVKITDFDTSPENTFYREKEWRNIGDFKFSKKDVAAIVVPEEFMEEMHKYLSASDYPNTINILAWEFIENA